MNLPEEAPRLPKLPFLVGDGILLVTAWFIAHQSDSPLSTAPLAAITGCVGLAALLGAAPFLFDDLRRQESYLTERQNHLEALARTTASSAELVGIAANGLNEIAERTDRGLRLVEHLPQKLQEKIHAFKEQLNEVAVAENESLQQEIATLRAAESEKLENALDRLTTLEAATHKHLAAIQDLPAVLERSSARARQNFDEVTAQFTATLTASLAAARLDLEQRLAEIVEKTMTVASAPPLPAAPPSLPPQVAPLPPLPHPLQETATAEAVPLAVDNPAPVSENNSPAFAIPNEAPPPTSEIKPRLRPSRIETPPEPDLFADVASDTSATEPPVRSLSSDGLTRLIVTAYIGIGNKLYLRGEGPSLSWEKGTPLEFVSIGKWRWESSEATAPIAVKLFKNDQAECIAAGTVILEPGHQHEVQATF